MNDPIFILGVLTPKLDRREGSSARDDSGKRARDGGATIWEYPWPDRAHHAGRGLMGSLRSSLFVFLLWKKHRFLRESCRSPLVNKYDGIPVFPNCFA